MDLCAIAMILFLYGMTQCKGQQLTISSLLTVTDCTDGLRENEDRLIFEGTANITEADTKMWRSYIEFVITYTISGEFLKVACYVKLSLCYKVGRAKDCYCQSISETAYKVVLNTTATDDLSNASVKMVWPRLDFKQIVSSASWNIPPIYKERSSVTTLHINSENINLLSKSCKLSDLSVPSTAQYCCYATPSPCLAKITSGGATVVGIPCAVANLTIMPKLVYKFTHSVCGRDSSKVVTCVGEKGFSAGHFGEEAPNFSGYRHAAIFLASTIAIGLIIATVHRLDASLLFASISGRRSDTCNIIRKY